MRDRSAYPRPTTSFLVEIAGSHVLVDAAGERLLVLNEAGARFWSAMQEGAHPRTQAEHAFVHELARLAQAPEREIQTAVPAGGDGPRVIGRAPLQVAANTSDPSPFSADSSW